MKSKSLILMVISLGFGLVAAVGISQVMGRNNSNQAPKTKMANVVVATDFLDHDTELNDTNCRVEEWPAEIVPENSAHSMDDIKAKAITTRINKGMPISLADIVDVTQISKIPIPPGWVVQGIKVNAEDVLNGIVRPGDHVDLIGTFEAAKPGGEKSVKSSTFMRGIRVFSINGNTQREVGQRKGSGSSGDAVLGLIVTRKQAEQIAYVQRVAALTVVLGDGGTAGANPELTAGSESNDSDASSFLDQIKNYVEKQAPRIQEVLTPRKTNEPAFVAVYQIGEDRIKVPFDAEGNIIIPDQKPAGAMQAASQAFQEQISTQENNPPKSDDDGGNNQDNSSDNEHDSEEDQYPKR